MPVPKTISFKHQILLASIYSGGHFNKVWRCRDQTVLILSLDFYIKLRCDTRFQRAFAACGCVFKVITLVWANQGNYFENTTSSSKCMLKTRVATQLQATSWLTFHRHRPQSQQVKTTNAKIANRSD